VAEFPLVGEVMVWFSSDLQKRLEDARYQTGWCTAARLSTLVDPEAWEVVLERDRNGMLHSFHIKGRDTDSIFVKRRRERLACSPIRGIRG
jgi:hypothetical protein